MERLISFVGLFVMMGLAWLMSAHKKRVSMRVVVGGLLLQIVFAFLVLKTAPGRWVFQTSGDIVTTMLSYVDEGSKFVFGPNFKQTFFAFSVLPTIVFFSALMSILYYLGVMQFVVKYMAIAMQKTLGTSGAESLSTAANIFVGQTEAPLVIKPFIAKMTDSELMAIMVGGFATIAGGVLAAFVGMGINATDLMTASVLAAPATLVIAKIMQPEVDEPVTKGDMNYDVEVTADNLVHAASEGAADGVKLAINVAGMLIAFMALIAMGNGLLGWVGDQFNFYVRGIAYADSPNWSIEWILSYLFYPLAWIMGIESKDCAPAGELLGLRLIASEFNAYERLSGWLDTGTVALTDRSVALITYALCGFATFASIGIQIGGIGPLAPERTKDIARLGLRAMLGGNLASFMTACVAGVFLTQDDFADRRASFATKTIERKAEAEKKLLEEQEKIRVQIKKAFPDLKLPEAIPSPPLKNPVDPPAVPPKDPAVPASPAPGAPVPAVTDPATTAPPAKEGAAADTPAKAPSSNEPAAKDTGPPPPGK
jgi:CNT family concentrative nucleoside transporter